MGTGAAANGRSGAARWLVAAVRTLHLGCSVRNCLFCRTSVRARSLPSFLCSCCGAPPEQLAMEIVAELTKKVNMLARVMSPVFDAALLWRDSSTSSKLLGSTVRNFQTKIRDIYKRYLCKQEGVTTWCRSTETVLPGNVFKPDICCLPLVLTNLACPRC